jgi:hypothetical protein
MRRLVTLHSSSAAMSTSKRQLCFRLVEDGNRIDSARLSSSAEVVVAIETDAAREGEDDPYGTRDENKGAQQFVGIHRTILESMFNFARWTPIRDGALSEIAALRASCRAFLVVRR